MRWWLVLLAVVAAEECHREFFAQPVVYDRAMSIDFYYTAINQQSTAACAAFCGERHFCRTAVYNSNAKTCAISYEYTLNCRYNNKRVKEFDARNSSSHLVQIACVPKCNELSSRTAQKQKILAGEPEELYSGPPSTLKRVQLITGEPNDGFREPTVRLARNRPRPVKDAKPETPGFVNKLVIENVNSGGILPVLDEKHMIRRKSQICYRLREKKYLMGSAFETHKDVSLQTCRCLCAHTYFTNSIFTCKSFNWRADGTCELSKGHHMGRYDLIDDNRYVYQFIDCDIQVLMGIANKFCTKDGLALSSTTTTTEATIITSPATETSTQVTVTTTLEPSTELTSTTTNPQETTQAARSEPKTTEAPPTSSTTTTPTAEASTIEATAEPTSSTVNSITPEEEKAGFIVSSRREGASKEDFLESEKSTESTSTEITTPTETITVTEQPTENITETTEVMTTSLSEESLPIEKATCFERIPGYMMGSVAAALEHDVTLEECECFCANSRASGRHGFDCTSATYYHSERDCVLNLEDRYQKKKYFAKQADFNVTYLGLTCPTEKAVQALVSPDKTYGCRAAPRVYKPKKKPNKGAFSDACFEEFHSHVLEGNAFHAETNATPQQCKCLCAASEQKFNETCQSFLYYYEGAVCLLSKNNRFSTPDKFSHLPDQLLRSYFEYKCASQEDKVKAYTQQMCLFQKAVDDAPAEKSNHTLTDQTSRPLTLLENGNSTLVEGEASSNHTLEGSGDALETTTELTTTTEAEITTIATTTKKVRTRKPINRAIPETEGLNDSDFEDLEGILSNNLEDPPTTPVPKKIHGVKTVKLTDKVEKAVQEDMTSTIITKPPSSSVTIPSTTKVTKSTRLTTTTTTEKPLEYPSAGKCTYSALYQTAFFGRRSIKTVHVKTATDCFAACYALHCRSANLIAQGTLNQCELFRDSLIDYRRPDMIGYDGSTVYFDGIRCDGI